MEKKKKKINKKEVLEWLLIIITGIIINVFCVLLFSCSTKAASISALPYYVDNDSFSFGNYSVDDILTYVNQNSNTPLDFESYPVIIYPFNDGADKLTVICGYPGNTTPIYYFDSFSEPYNSFDTSVDSVSFNYTHSCKFVVWVDRGNLRCNRWFDYTFTYSFFGQYYFPNYLSMPLYDNTYINNVFSVGENLVLTNQLFFHDSGHAVPPDFSDPDLDINTNFPNRFTWQTSSNPPTFDSSDIPKSTYDLIEWGIKDPNGPFQCLSNNLKNSIEYLGDVIKSLGKSINKNIQNQMSNLYDNFVGLFEPIAENIQSLIDKIDEVSNFFLNPFDEEEFEEQMANSDFLNAYNELMDNADDIRAIINNAEERDHFSLYISFDNPLATTNHRIIQSEINFDWLVPLRSVYRPFLWVCTLIELFVGGARVLTHALGGDGI